MSKIRKIDVATGITWIEIPEAELSVLCGCPADSVKHLMKRGLAVPAETDGVAHETGPNAILLSDSLIQHGAFSNLAEFPVLQMLYRQGIILPGHPKNTGRKPLLIGSESQVQAQMRYIYRGNYGLVNEQELIKAGFSPERAKEEMRLKMRFAFGAIKKTDEFLDTLTAGPMPVEIRNGATIRRLESNVFEFAYEDERVRVDLNLPPGMAYPSPYPLGFRNVGREYFSIIHSGDGDGWDVERPTMSAIIMFQGDIFLIDAGPNIDHALTALGIGVNEVRGIFHTHAHDDHFCGLTTLMQTDHRIEHYATEAVRASVAKKWGALLSRPEREFSKYFDIHTLEMGSWNDVGGLEVKPMYSPHPVETTIMAFRAMGEHGYRTYAHWADIASRRVLNDFTEDDESKPGITSRRVEEVWRDYLEEADVKKLDIGGGLIHGEAVDFVDDPSRRIILSHTALKLTDEQKEIGSEASFGTEDVLIESKQDYIRAKAYRYLKNYLISAKDHELRMLMNGEVETISPGTILLKRGQSYDDVRLVITGVVEKIDSDRGLGIELSAGALVGELAGFTGRPSSATFRAMTYVRVLRLPARLLADVVIRSGLADAFEAQRASREFLQGTWLLGDALSSRVQNELTEGMIRVSYPEGSVIAYGNDPAIYVLTFGAAELRYGERVVGTIGEGDFFGEGFVLFGTPCVTSAVATSDVEVIILHEDLLEDIPVVRWKLFETFRHRMEAIVAGTETSGDVFKWREEYSTGVPIQDSDHKGLMAKAKTVNRAIVDKMGQGAIDQALGEMLEFTAAHFKRELGWYEDEEFPELEHHRRLHAELMAEVRAKAKRIKAETTNAEIEFMIFFKNWLIDHIMTEDRKFGRLMELREAAKQQ